MTSIAKVLENNNGILDNHAEGKVGDFLARNIEPASKLSFVTAFFTIYAYERLKNNLDSVAHLRFLLGEPKFIKEISPDGDESKAFSIVDSELALEKLSGAEEDCQRLRGLDQDKD